MGRQDYAIYSPEGTRHCPECGTRVAQEADTCFFCGASLRSRPRRIAVPFAELLVTALIALIALGWWQTRGTRLLAYRAVFTATAMQDNEGTLILTSGQFIDNIFIDIDTVCIDAFILQRSQYGITAQQ